MSHRCDMLGSLLPRWTYSSGYDINLITLVFLDQIARVAHRIIFVYRLNRTVNRTTIIAIYLYM
jgi:hypothetical protein